MIADKNIGLDADGRDCSLSVRSSLSDAQTAKPTGVPDLDVSDAIGRLRWEIHASSQMDISLVFQKRLSAALRFATAAPAKPDVPAIQRLIAGLGASGNVDFILTGHSHFYHSFDTAVWAKLTGARIIGSRSTCLEAVAQGIRLLSMHSRRK